VNGGGKATLTNVTISGNSASGPGGGIANYGKANLTNLTISGNAAQSGGGIKNAGSATLNNTIVANSTRGGDIENSFGSVSGSNNLIDDAASAGGFTNGVNGNIVGANPLLAPLSNYGGPTETMALLPGSPAIDAGDTALAVDAHGNPLTADQRGMPRLVGAAVDIGAFESSGFTLTVAAGDNQSTPINSDFPTALEVTVTPNNSGDPVNGGVVTFTPPSTGASAILSGSGIATINSGDASVTATANATAGGPYTVTAGGAEVSSVSFSLRNTLGSATDLSSSANPSSYGQPVMLTATVANTSGSGGIPTGSVEFFAGSTDLGAGTPLRGSGSSATSTFRVATMTPGTYSISAVYTPTGDYAGSNGTSSQTVNPAVLTVSGISAANKVYNASTSATLNMSGATLAGVINGDTINLDTSTAIGTFASDNVGNGIAVTVAGLTISGAQAGDYTLSQPSTTANITPAGLTVLGITALNKVYNASVIASLDTPGATLVGVLSGDAVYGDARAATGLFASVGVGTAITVTVSGVTIRGSQAADYALTQPTTTANITPAALTVSGIAAPDKVYDGSTAAALNTADQSLLGVFSGDTVTLNSGSATGTFASDNVGTGITVTVAGLTISGAQAGDYTLTQPTTTADITPAVLTVSGIAATNKVYNADTVATLNTANATLLGVISGDTVNLDTGGAAGTFASRSVGTGITVTVSGLTISGAQARDYTLTQPTTTATITPATPALSVSDAGGTYNGSAASASALVTGVNGHGASSLEAVAPTLVYYAGSTASGAPLSHAPINAGIYTVVADFPGSADYLASASAPVTFTIAKAVPMLVVTDSGGVYDGSAFNATASVAGVTGPPASTLEGVPLALVYYAGSAPSGTPLSGAPIQIGTYTVVADFPGSSDYLTSISAPATFTIAKSAPQINWNPPAPIVYGTPLGSGQLDASANVAGTFIYSPPSGTILTAGEQSLSVIFTPDDETDYAAATGSTTIDVAKATPTVIVADAGGIFDDSAFNASASVTGVRGQAAATLEGTAPSLTYYAGSAATGTPLAGAPIEAGKYTVVADFFGSAEYTASTSQAVTFAISRATPTVNISVAGGIYDDSAFNASPTVTGVGGQTASSLEGFAPTPVYYTGSIATGTPLSGAPVHAGTYTVVAEFPGSADYLASTSAPTTFTVAKATPTVSINAAEGTFNGSAFEADPAVSGISGAPASTLEGVAPAPVYYAGSIATGTPLSGAPVHAGTYTVVAEFPGSADYLASTSAPTTFTVAKATPQIAWNPMASIVYGTPVGNGQLDASASVSGTFAYNPATGIILAAGEQSLSAAFTPDDAIDYNSASGSTTIDVSQATPTVSVFDPGEVFNGSASNAILSITGVGGQAGSGLEGIAPSPVYYAGSRATGIPLAGAPIEAGTYTVVATFPGSTDYAATQSAPVTFTIGQGSAKVVLTSSSTRAAYGQRVTLVATVSGAGGNPTGIVTFFANGTALGSAPLGGSDSATLTITTLAPGPHSITATYGGDTDFRSAVSGSASESIARAASQVALAPSGVFKNKNLVSVVLTARIVPMSPGAGTPTGTVTFLFKKKTLGSVALRRGLATLTFKTSSVLNRAITVVYRGSPDFQSSAATSPTLTQTLLKSVARPMIAMLQRMSISNW